MGYREELQSSFASRERSVNMSGSGMKALAVSIGKEAWSSEGDAVDVGGICRPELGKRVPWGAAFAKGAKVAEAMKTSIAHGDRKVNFGQAAMNLFLASQLRADQMPGSPQEGQSTHELSLDCEPVWFGPGPTRIWTGVQDLRSQRFGNLGQVPDLHLHYITPELAEGSVCCLLHLATVS